MEQIKTAVPIKEGLWTRVHGKDHLLGSKCINCGECFFPKKEYNFCAQCHQKTVEETLFTGEGKVLAYTKVDQQPAGGFYKGPVPYTYGIVQLEEGVNIYATLVNKDGQEIEVNQLVTLVIDKLYEEEQKVVMTYKFQPKGEGDCHDNSIV